MQLEQAITALKQLFENYSNSFVSTIETLPISGSERRYFRFSNTKGQSVLGVFNLNKAENEAFISFSQSFKSIGLPVPEVLAESSDKLYYLVEDLGNESLLSMLEQQRTTSGKDFPDSMYVFYRQALQQLALLQTEGAKVIDFKRCYPTDRFDRRAMLWDCNLFKYWFLFPTQTIFDEAALEDDFEALCDFLEQPDCPFFMFRDFQARNIMVNKEQVYFIDYQGGRKGPLQYDVASLLFQAKAALPDNVRATLLEDYLQALEAYIDIDKELFKKQYYGFVLLRCLQVLGAYGFKGYYQRKAHFLSSIPFALDNLRWWLQAADFPLKMQELRRVLQTLAASTAKFPGKETSVRTEAAKPLHLQLRSFSYRNGLPEDESGGHGQGFIFDCRLIHNPGRYEDYKNLTGLDKEVCDFLEKDGEMAKFLSPIHQILEQAIDKYLQRGFEYLGISFGCTGGQHRSVYAAMATLAYLKKKYADAAVQFSLEHRELNIKMD